jgi:hypothetical protein
MAMTDEEIDAQLAILKLDRRWVDLGVLTEEWLSPTGAWRTRRYNGSPEWMLRQALFNYLKDRTTLDDITLTGLLDAAARAGEEFSHELASWSKLTVEQLVQITRHGASAPDVCRLAAQRLRVHALEAGERVTVNLVGFDKDKADDSDGPHGAASVFEVGHPSHPPAFRFGIAWERQLTTDEGCRVGVLLAAIPEEEGMRCHEPVFGLRLDPGAPDETRMSICFKCNNIYLHAGGRRTFSGLSSAGRALLDYLLELAPADWGRRIKLLGA